MNIAVISNLDHISVGQINVDSLYFIRKGITAFGKVRDKPNTGVISYGYYKNEEYDVVKIQTAELVDTFHDADIAIWIITT